MTQAEKLEALVKKAVEAGDFGISTDHDKRYKGVKVLDVTENEDGGIYVFVEYGKGKSVLRDNIWVATSVLELIFNHDFVHALFGNYDYADIIPKEVAILNEVAHNYEETIWGHPWQAHLQLAVISNDPIDYLYKAVFGS